LWFKKNTQEHTQHNLHARNNPPNNRPPSLSPI